METMEWMADLVRAHLNNDDGQVALLEQELEARRERIEGINPDDLTEDEIEVYNAFVSFYPHEEAGDATEEPVEESEVAVEAVAEGDEDEDEDEGGVGPDGLLFMDEELGPETQPQIEAALEVEEIVELSRDETTTDDGGEDDEDEGGVGPDGLLLMDEELGPETQPQIEAAPEVEEVLEEEVAVPEAVPEMAPVEEPLAEEPPEEPEPARVPVPVEEPALFVEPVIRLPEPPARPPVEVPEEHRPWVGEDPVPEPVPEPVRVPEPERVREPEPEPEAYTPPVRERTYFGLNRPSMLTLIGLVLAIVLALWWIIGAFSDDEKPAATNAATQGAVATPTPLPTTRTPTPEPTPEPKPEPKPEPAPVAKPEPKPEPKPEDPQDPKPVTAEDMERLLKPLIEANREEELLAEQRSRMLREIWRRHPGIYGEESERVTVEDMVGEEPCTAEPNRADCLLTDEQMEAEIFGD